jgi:uncharacterized protein YcbX
VSAPRITRLFVYPVKSLAGVEVARMPIDARGPVDDRRFVVVDAADRFVTQRDHPKMALLRATLDPGGLTLGTDGGAVRVPLEGDGPEREVAVWGDRVRARDRGDEVAAFLSGFLGLPVRLMQQRGRRPLRRFPEDEVGFADGYPFLLVGQASVDAVNARVRRHDVDVRRFRPNIVVDGLEAFGEDRLSRLRLGDVTFRAPKRCPRCAMVDVDPDAGAPTKGVLATLTTFRREGTDIFFGMNLIHDGPGEIAVGDRLEPLG